ncbi:MAG: RNA polymerase sigma factor [Planctomycetota bacterium]
MHNSSFLATRWSMIRGAASEDPGLRLAALERLCAQYWYPLYAYQRKRGRNPEQAADSVQDLFAHLLEGDLFARIKPQAGRFRNWLLTVLQNYESDQRDRDRAEKRGGGRAPISIDQQEGERRLELHGRQTDDPQFAFERAWATETLRMARDQLQQEMQAQGKAAIYSALATLLDDADAPSRAELAAELGVRPVALRVMLHRMRSRYRELLVDIVADSLGDRSESGEELAALANALRENSGQSS